MAWRVYAAAAIGKSHIDNGTPCQDAFASRVTGETLVACVCDGAGSQPLSQEGSRLLSDQVVELLSGQLAQQPLLPQAELEPFRASVVSVVGAVRAMLQKKAQAEGAVLANFSATLVGVIANPTGGYFFHVGDGVGVACIGSAASAGGDAATEIISLPENGEYANETYFVSGEEWQEHLHVTAIAGPIRELALMSDGAMPFVMAKDNTGLFRPFMDPVSGFLASVSEVEGSKALAATLEDARTYNITGDDKSLLIAQSS